MDTLISNVTVVTMNEKMEILFGAYLGIEAGKISYIDTAPPEASPATIVDGTGMVCMPGLINCHTHLATTALRSYCDDLAQREQLEQQLSREDKMDRRSAKAAALLGIAECLRFGITSVSDLYYFPEAVAEAAAESGIKANIALSATGLSTKTKTLILTPTSSASSCAAQWKPGTAMTAAASA
ncbi:MAG: amidohydrolase family protein [Oscillospiraceae bacterium]|nr:amidohydrolase family protein [Oscillospiraceae bacterium]